MKAALKDQLLLLDLQECDTRESALRHARDSHPAHTTVREFAARGEDLKRAIITQGAVVTDIQREAKRIEDEIEKVTARRNRQQERLDNNEVPLRDYNAMQHEIAQMDTRLAKLEADGLEAEEKIEVAQAAIESMKTQVQGIAADVEKTKAQFLADIAATDDELRGVIARRKEIVEALPADLVAEYDIARAKNGALAVVEIKDGIVKGLGNDFAPAELEAIRLTPADEIYWAEDTGQIVVRH